VSEADTGTPRVLLVDDHDLLVQSLVIALGVHGVRAHPAPLDSVNAVTRAAEDLPADLVLLDLDLGGALGNGADLVRGLRDTGARVLVLTGSATPARVADAVERGAIGALRKDAALEQLVRTVVAAAHGEAVMDPEDRRAMIAAARTRRRERDLALEPFARLTPREAEVLRALAGGRSVGRMATDWFVSEATVRTQVRGVLTKLGVRTQLEAVALARDAGWPDDRG
jgi:DNA-binding NarL/FixJ family response regulator